MKQSDILLGVGALCAVALAGVAVSRLVSRNVTIVEFLFVALPILFVLALCWQASKYYIIVSEGDTGEWDAPGEVDGNDTVASTGSYDGGNSEHTDEQRTQSQE
jgi:hypothetical protein